MQGLWWRVEVVRDGHERPRIENDCPKMRASAFPEATAHLPTTTHEQAGMAAKTQHTNHQPRQHTPNGTRNRSSIEARATLAVTVTEQLQA